ncbi:MAG: MMPL family transporter [Acidimicrobiia bacterium]|nr:MMPL family transporter [Acidimicrobiia bacterium]
MHRLLAPLAHLASRHPGRVLVALAAITVAFGIVASEQSTDTELTAFAPDSELAAALDRVRTEFGADGATLQVVVDAGPGGDVTGPAGLVAVETVRDVVASSDVAVSDRPDAVTSFADLDAMAAQLLSTGAPGEPPRAGLVVVRFSSALTEDEVARASVELDGLLGEVEFDGVRVDGFNNAILGAALEEESTREMPRLLGLSMLLILVILALQFRSVSDVIIGLVGLVATITWMTGVAVLLGPSYLGWVGPFTQISMIVPVLLVGLGVDYAIHLTSRYREERSLGLMPAHASAMAVRTVGGALVLATVTTIVGFLTNVVSPLPPMADFGIFTAVGVLSAFIIMVALVPSARHLLDARRARAGRPTSPRRSASGTGALAGFVGRVAVVAERTPRLALGVALVVSLAAAGAATQVGTTFDQDEFIPDDSDAADLVDRIDELFGGGLTELTYVVADGDLADPDVVREVARVGGALAEVDGVRVVDGVVQANSPVVLADTLMLTDESFAQAASELGYGLGGVLGPDAEAAAVWDLVRQTAPERAARVLASDDGAAVLAVSTTAGQDGARALEADLQELLGPLGVLGVTTTITSEPLVLDESLDALTSSQARGILITLLAALALLMVYFGVRERTPLLGLITMIPSLAVVSWVLGTMWVLGISFNVLTAMVASLGIGIGVPYGIHITHRFLEDRRRYDTVEEAIRRTVTHTGGAMAGSAATTAAGFGVLMLASLVPIQQFGLIVAITIVYSFIAAVFIQPACLILWARHRAARGEVVDLLDHERRDTAVPEADQRQPAMAGSESAPTSVS